MDLYETWWMSWVDNKDNPDSDLLNFGANPDSDMADQLDTKCKLLSMTEECSLPSAVSVSPVCLSICLLLGKINFAKYVEQFG